MAVKKKRAPAKRKATPKRKVAPKRTVKKRVTKKRAAPKRAVPKRFKNPIKGKRVSPFYAAYIVHEGDRYYYGGSKANGSPIFDSDIKKAFISHEKTPLANHMRAELRAHVQKATRLYVIRVHVTEAGEILPGE